MSPAPDKGRPQACNIDQNTAGKNTIFQNVDAVLAAAFLRDFKLRETVIHLPVREDVAERVKMCMGESVIRNFVAVHRAVATILAGADHLVFVGSAINNRLFFLGFMRQ